MAGRYYDVLGIAQDATIEDIKRAFRGIARTCHPDVAGDDPQAAQRFMEAREAYDHLIDPEKRAAYDRPAVRPKRKARSGDSSFFRAAYRRASGSDGAETRSGPRTEGGERSGSGGLDDLFADFGFGDDGGRSGFSHQARFRGQAGGGGAPRRGDDLTIDVEVPASVARDGGPWTVNYGRLVREPGGEGAGVKPFRGEQVIDVPAATRPASVRRYPGLGDAGAYGGPTGDLIVRFRVGGRVGDDGLGGAREAKAAPARSPEAQPGRFDVPISVVEALLGGRIEIDTPGGRVKMAIPPGTSSGRVFRLKGRGAPDGTGEPADLHVTVQIVVPTQLDEPSRALIEAFARLNPDVPER